MPRKRHHKQTFPKPQPSQEIEIKEAAVVIIDIDRFVMRDDDGRDERYTSRNISQTVAEWVIAQKPNLLYFCTSRYCEEHSSFLNKYAAYFNQQSLVKLAFTHVVVENFLGLTGLGSKFAAVVTGDDTDPENILGDGYEVMKQAEMEWLKKLDDESEINFPAIEREFKSIPIVGKNLLLRKIIADAEQKLGSKTKIKFVFGDDDPLNCLMATYLPLSSHHCIEVGQSDLAYHDMQLISSNTLGEAHSSMEETHEEWQLKQLIRILKNAPQLKEIPATQFFSLAAKHAHQIFDCIHAKLPDDIIAPFIHPEKKQQNPHGHFVDYEIKFDESGLIDFLEEAARNVIENIRSYQTEKRRHLILT